MKTVPSLFAALVVLPCAALAGGDVIAVLELHSRIVGEDQPDAAALTEQVRGVGRRALPEARLLTREETLALPGSKDDLKLARGLGADRLVTGEMMRLEDGLLVTLALYETKEGKLIATASGSGKTPEELAEAVAGAAVDLFRASQPVPSGMAIGPLPEVPAAPGPLPEGGAVTLDADANVLVAYDKARSAEAAGKDRPDVAAAAWRELAEMRGANPFRETAEMRARQWETYGETRRAYEAQLARDTGRLRKILPLASVTESAKLDLLVRFARAYGPAEAAPLVSLLPGAALRVRADLVLGCEAKEPDKCLALANAADEAKDVRAALDYFEQACDAGAADACAEAGSRWLSPGGRDATRALAALQRGCAAKSAAACARLARVYEEGDGTDVNLVLAAELREKACAAGDGQSCRKLACNVESGSSAADQARALDLWQQGCAHGDSISCTLAQLSAAPAGPAQASAAKAEQEATASAKPAVAATKPARKHSAVGGILLGFSLAAASGAFYLANSDDGPGPLRYGRNFYYEMRRDPGFSRADSARLLGAAAVLSGVAGVIVLLSNSSPDPAAPQVAVGAAPAGVVVSGNFR